MWLLCYDCCSPISTKMCDRKAVIKNADMSEEMQQDAVDCATQALEKFNIEKVMPLASLTCTLLYILYTLLSSSSA